MTDERREAADITRAIRRYLERERAGGGADLLADGAARALRLGSLAGGEVGRPEGPPGSAGAQQAAGSGGTPPGSDPGRSGSSPVAGPGTRPPATGAGRGSPPHPEPAGPLPAATNLFGEVEPATGSKRNAGASAGVLDTPTLGRFEEGLNPGGLEARAELAESALAVLTPIADEVRGCTRCGLCDTRTQAVPGVGTARSGIVFVGEAPGADEDRLGEPFVGRAGQLLDRIIKAMDDARLLPGMPLDRTTVYICNVLKCRPPENRNPLPHEIESCSPYLRRQLDAMRPRLICCLGKFAAELLVGVKGTIGSLRGKVYRYQGAKLIVTYHPAACLRNPAYKRPVWEDMQLLAREYLSD